MRTHSDIDLLIRSPLQDVYRLVTTCTFLASVKYDILTENLTMFWFAMLVNKNFNSENIVRCEIWAMLISACISVGAMLKRYFTELQLSF